MTHKCTTIYEFEYNGVGKDDPGIITIRIYFDYTPGTPETGRYGGPPENYDPGSGCEIAFDYAEQHCGVNETTGFLEWKKLIPGEWLDEHCRAWLAHQDESGLGNDLPDDGPDPDDARDRMMERE